MFIEAERVRSQIVLIFTAWGLDTGHIQTAADVMIATDLSGVDSHGISMLMDYNNSRLKGKLNLKAKPRIVRESPATALIDADAGLGHPAAVMGMNLAIKKASNFGVGIVTVKNSHHFGAAGYYAGLALKMGFLGMVTSATRTINTVPTRGKNALLGTNPIAFAAPTQRNEPFLLDMATSSVAANKVRVHELNGKPLPPGWVLDSKGEPVTDASEAMDILFKRTEYIGGGLTPIGGTPQMASYKGYGLAMMAHILGGVLSGSSFSPIRVKSQQPKDPDNLGHFFMAINPNEFREEGEFESDLDQVIDVLHQSPRANPEEPILVAGEPEAAKRMERLREGIPISPALSDMIRRVCESSGAEFILGHHP